MFKINLVSKRKLILVLAENSGEREKYINSLPTDEWVGLDAIEFYGANWHDAILENFCKVNEIVVLDGWEKKHDISRDSIESFVNSQRNRFQGTSRFGIR